MERIRESMKGMDKTNVSYVTKITQPCLGHRWVATDIHGCSQTFKYLVEAQIQLKKEDHLYLLGDYINRGPDSAGVIDFVIHLEKEGFQIFPLRGNHEDMFLNMCVDAEREHRGHKFVRIFKSLKMLDEEGVIRPHYLEFMQSLPYCYELADFYLVHAGFNFKDGKPFEDRRAMMWTMGFEADEAYLGGRRIVHGHLPTALERIKSRIQNKELVLCLDNGVYRHFNPKPRYERDGNGHLCALNLDTMDLLVCQNIDQYPPKAKGHADKG